MKNNAFALSTIDKLKDYRPKRNRRTGGGHSGFNTPSAFRVGFGGVSNDQGGYFSSPAMGRSRANTPPFGNGSPHQMNSPNVPDAPEPSHQSLWSRLPIPPAFRSSQEHRQNLPSTDNAIPLQITNQHFNLRNERRTTAGHPNKAGAKSQTLPGSAVSSSQPDSANASVPTTPAEISDANKKLQGKKNKKSKKVHLFGKKAATAQQIARQAMVDPLKTLNDPDVVGKGLGLDIGGAKDAKKLARDLFYAFRSVS